MPEWQWFYVYYYRLNLGWMDMILFLTYFWPALRRCVLKILVGLCLGKNILCFAMGKTYYALAWENILCFGGALAWEKTYYAELSYFH
jgi:hypothetical protein